MADPSGSFNFSFTDALSSVTAVVMGFLMFIFRGQADRIKILESKKADVKVVDEKFETLVMNIDDKFDDIKSRLDRQDTASSQRDRKLDDIVDSISDIRANATRTNGNRRRR